MTGGPAPRDCREQAVADARAAVEAWFPEARAAWLGGSVVAGTATSGSDLDITVLLPGPPAPFRDSRRHRGWPVELFVHTETSLRHYAERDAEAGRPTMPRLLGRSVVLVDRDGSGARWQERGAELLDAGPPAWAPEDLAAQRYAVTDLLDDLVHAHDEAERLSTAGLLAEEAQRLLLAGERRWVGRGKWMVREVGRLDAEHGTDWAGRFARGIVSNASGDTAPLAAVVSDVLDRLGGPLFEGHRLAGTDPGSGNGRD